MIDPHVHYRLSRISAQHDDSVWRRLLFLLLKGQNQQRILIVNICILIGRRGHAEDKAANSAGTAAACTEHMRKHCVLLLN